ncbi:transcription factor bHLH162-like [Bidens hawaiensis]|uniref:transcription factor bHLH162-like n=1 Tax=Bidens hawaiensis TaxID=980011 RepID=UPI00404B811A
MDGGIKFSASRSQKPERKIIEKNRRNQMKKLYCHLYSLVPHHFISKAGNGVTDRVDRTIEYIQTLKSNVEMSKNKKEKLLSKKRTQEHIARVNKVCSDSLDIQIQEISHDLDAVLVTGLNDYSSFCGVVRLLGQYSAEVTLANFSSTGHSTFHIRQKEIEADDVCKRLKNLAGGYSNGIKELDEALFCNEVDPDLSIWDFDFQTSVWGCELGMILNTNG